MNRHKQRMAEQPICTSVVICLKISTFESSQTTARQIDLPLKSCDLLKNQYFWIVTNNFKRKTSLSQPVVICLKISTFESSQTTGHLTYSLKICCDLLKNQYFWIVTNNSTTKPIWQSNVVICLKISTFESSQTTQC